MALLRYVKYNSHMKCYWTELLSVNATRQRTGLVFPVS
jgi:hypothetical protein